MCVTWRFENLLLVWISWCHKLESYYLSKVNVRACLFHGPETLGVVVNSPERRIAEGGTIQWNEPISFDVKLQNLPRMARLCFMLYTNSDQRTKPAKRTDRIATGGKKAGAKRVNSITWRNLLSRGCCFEGSVFLLGLTSTEHDNCWLKNSVFCMQVQSNAVAWDSVVTDVATAETPSRHLEMLYLNDNGSCIPRFSPRLLQFILLQFNS